MSENRTEKNTNTPIMISEHDLSAMIADNVEIALEKSGVIRFVTDKTGDESVVKIIPEINKEKYNEIYDIVLNEIEGVINQYLWVIGAVTEYKVNLCGDGLFHGWIVANKYIQEKIKKGATN